jgi:chemotaxis protein histidine kinase CheA
VKIVTLREALDILELNPNSLDRPLLESTLRKNLETIELRNVMRLLEAYRKANAFINPTLATHGDVRVTMIDEPVPDGPPLNQRPAAKRLSDESSQKLKRDFVPGATFDESILKAPRTSSPPTLSDASIYATQEIMPSELPAISPTTPATKKTKNNVLITPEDRAPVPESKGISILWAGLTAVAGVAAAIFLVVPAISPLLLPNAGVQTAVPPAITKPKPVNTTKPPVSSNTTKPPVSSSTTKPPVSSNNTSNATQNNQVAKLEAQKLAAQKLEAQKLATQKLAAQKLEAQKLAAQKLEAQKLAAQKLEAQKLAAQKLEAQKLAAQKLEAQKLAAQKVQTTKPNTSTATSNAQLEAQAALRAAQRRAAIRAEANRRFLAQQRLEAERLAVRQAEQQAIARREAQQASARREAQQASARQAEQQAAARQAAAKRASVSVRSVNQGSFNSWDRAGAVLRYPSWAAIPDSIRALPTAQFRAQVYVASSPATLPGIPR